MTPKRYHCIPCRVDLRSEDKRLHLAFHKTPATIEIMPGKQAGVPCLRDTRIQVPIIAHYESIETAIRDFCVTREMVLVARWFQAVYGERPWIGRPKRPRPWEVRPRDFDEPAALP